MIVFLKRYWMTIGLLFVCSAIGLYTYIKEPPIDIWRIDYEFDASVESTLPKIIQADTVYEYEGIVCRNYSSSIGDTLIDAGIRRNEMKLYLPRPSKEVLFRVGNGILSTGDTRILAHRFIETQRNKRGFLYWILFGFFLGMVVEFILRLKKQPSTN